MCWCPKQLQLVWRVVVSVVEGLKAWYKLITYVNVAANNEGGKPLRGSKVTNKSNIMLRRFLHVLN